MSAVADRVLDVMAEKGRVPRDRLTPDARLEELGIASLDTIEIVFALEETFDIDIPFNAKDARSEFATVGEVVRAVEAVLAAAPPAASATPA